MIKTITDFFRAIMHSNPLNDYVYPWLLDKYGHDTARRVCSAIALVAMFTIVPPLVVLLWVYNCVADLGVNVGFGWFQAVRDHIDGVIKGAAEDDEDQGA